MTDTCKDCGSKVGGDCLTCEDRMEEFQCRECEQWFNHYDYAAHVWYANPQGEQYYLCTGCHDQRDYYAGKEKV